MPVEAGTGTGVWVGLVTRCGERVLRDAGGRTYRGSRALQSALDELANPADGQPKLEDLLLQVRTAHL